MTCRRAITPSSSIAPRMLQTLIISDFLPPKTKSELKETRNDSLFFRATVSYHPRNWCLPWHWRIHHPRHFWLWLICLFRSNLTLLTMISSSAFYIPIIPSRAMCPPLSLRWIARREASSTYCTRPLVVKSAAIDGIPSLPRRLTEQLRLSLIVICSANATMISVFTKTPILARGQIKTTYHRHRPDSQHRHLLAQCIWQSLMMWDGWLAEGTQAAHLCSRSDEAWCSPKNTTFTFADYSRRY